MTDKQIIKQQQTALVNTERALSESRKLIMNVLNDIRLGKLIGAEIKLANYVKEIAND